VSFQSDKPDVAQFTQDGGGFNGDVGSGVPGVAVITGRVTMPDGTFFEDTLTVTVTNSAPGSANFTVGTPADEGT
jgi:hypothetical protein